MAIISKIFINNNIPFKMHIFVRLEHTIYTKHKKQLKIYDGVFEWNVLSNGYVFISKPCLLLSVVNLNKTICVPVTHIIR